MAEHADEERPTTTQELQLEFSGVVTKAGRFECDLITAGEAMGHGIKFSAEVLKDSVELWEGVECFVDHGSFWSNRSVRDLGGVFTSARWSSEAQGIRAELDTLGPAGPLVDALGRELLEAETGKRPRVGFSADVSFQMNARREAKKILRVREVSLVFNPARGGAFVRALNSVGDAGRHRSSGAEQTISLGGPIMDEHSTNPTQPAEAPVNGQGRPLSNQLAQDAAAVAEMRELMAQQAEAAEQAEAMRAIRLQMCEHLLDAGLTAAKLPGPAAEQIRKQFSGRVFEPAELTEAIEDSRELVSQLTGGAAVAGLGQVSGMFSSEDQLQAAVDDLLGAPREKDAQMSKVARLSGIRELYLMLTGDRNFYGGYYPSRTQLATTADFTGLVANSLNKIVANQWALLGAAGYDWWQRITIQEHFETLNDITGVLVGTVGSLPTVAEGAEYTELAIGDSPETASFTKYGGYVPLTLELIDRDNTRKLQQYPRELAKAGLRKISALVAAVFTANSGVGPTMADTGALFNATAVTSAGGHANLLTTALAAAEWEVVSKAVYNQPLLIKNAAGLYGTGPKQAIEPRYCLVPRALRLTAMGILYPNWDRSVNVFSENLQRGAEGDVVVVPEWTDATDWAAVVDPVLSPGIVVGERFGLMPEIFVAGDELSPAVFTNDEHRIKVRHFLAVLVQDFRPLHKSNVAG